MDATFPKLKGLRVRPTATRRNGKQWAAEGIGYLRHSVQQKAKIRGEFDAEWHNNDDDDDTTGNNTGLHAAPYFNILVDSIVAARQHINSADIAMWIAAADVTPRRR